MNGRSLYWYRTENNFGDAFSPMVVRYCFGFVPRHGGKWDASMVAEGSVLDFTLVRDLPCNRPFAAMTRSVRIALNRQLRSPLVIWGSGMLFPFDRGKRLLPIRRPCVLAVRGELTRRELVGQGLLDARAEVALGDPGLFMPEVLSVSAAKRCKARRGFVMHAFFWNMGLARTFAAEHPDIFLIDPRNEPDRVVREIATCSEVFSSSLHGLVAADALGIPNRWVELETPFADAAANRFKFNDYYSAFGVVRTPCRMTDVARGVVADPVERVRIESALSGLRTTAMSFRQTI